MTVPLRPLHPTHRVRVGRRRQGAADQMAKVVGNHVVVSDAIAVAMDPLEQFDEFYRLDNESGLFPDLTDHSLAKGFTDIDEAAGQRPLPFRGLMAALHEENSPFVDHDCPDPDQWR